MSSGVGVTKAPFINFFVSKIVKYLLDYLNHIHIWQVPPQLRCDDTCQIYTWYSIVNVCFDNAQNLVNNGMEEIGLVPPTPGPQSCYNITDSLKFNVKYKTSAAVVMTKFGSHIMSLV